MKILDRYTGELILDVNKDSLAGICLVGADLDTANLTGAILTDVIGYHA